MRKLILPALALSLVVGLVSAASAEGNGDVNVQMNRPALEGNVSGHTEWHDGSHMASSTMTMRHGTSTPEMRHASSTSEMHSDKNGDKHGKGQAVMGVPGLVVSVGANSFTMTVPAGKDHATTTVTVNVASSTVFNAAFGKGGRDDRHSGTSNASTTASLSNLAVGSHVVVLGRVSTSTNSVAASRVIVTGSFQKSDTEKNEAKGNMGGIISRIKELLGKHGTSTVNVQASSTSAAAVQGSILSSILHALFGWM